MELIRNAGSVGLDWRDASANSGSRLGVVDAPAAMPDPPIAPANTIVLQPQSLEGETGQVFQQSLADALASASAILIDLIWIETTSSRTLDILLQALQQAERLGKSLSFLSMDAQSQAALDRRWEQQISATMADRQEIFAPEFEEFLANYQARKAATILAVDIATKRQR
jgi:anti-anti-sigma regulatory factor